ncbi:TPA: scaffolding protein, partial [Escherichia coli]|nr:scaffolding protein [Escherichia coli]
MDQMAENTSEVEIETDTSEQIPDDVELAEEVETEDDGESSGDDAEEVAESDDDGSEQEFYFGDEKLDSPTSEDGAGHGLVKHLRRTIKEKDRELKELMRQSQIPVEQQPVITQPPRMPKMDDEDIGFDEELYQQRMAKWAEDNGRYQQQEMARKQQEQAFQAAYQERVSKYQQRVKSLKVPG